MQGRTFATSTLSTIGEFSVVQAMSEALGIPKIVHLLYFLFPFVGLDVFLDN